MTRKLFGYIACLAFASASSCSDEKLNVPQQEQQVPTDPLDVYIQEKFIDEFGVAVRYKYVDRYVEGDRRVSPPARESVIPMLSFLERFWIEPFLSVENGDEFFKSHVPAEIVLIGSLIYNSNGTVILGTADAGARITLTEVNAVDTTSRDWILRQLGTIYHEFAHIVHQRYALPAGFQQVSPQGYTSPGSWYSLTDEEALRRGFVSPYGTSSFNEDFAEIVAFLLFDPQFFQKFIEDESGCTSTDCIERNEGRERLRQKYNMILQHYEENTGVDLLEVRDLIQMQLPSEN